MNEHLIERAACRCYMGSSFFLGPWFDLPESRKHAYRKQAAHMIAPVGERKAAVEQVAALAVSERKRENGRRAEERRAA